MNEKAKRIEDERVGNYSEQALEEREKANGDMSVVHVRGMLWRNLRLTR